MTKKEIAARIESYGSGHIRIINALKEFPEEMWQFKPSPSQWSIHEIIIHLADSETMAYGRCRRFIAEPGSRVMAYDQDLWASRLNYHSQSTEEALELFKYLRVMTYGLIKYLPEDNWNNIVEHSENGIMKLSEWLVTYDEHVNKHISQMKRVHDQWLKEGAVQPAVK